MTVRPVHVVVVAFHAAEALAQCLEPLRDRPRVTVVDNSADPLVADVARAAGAELLVPGCNLGFGAGVNVALRGLLMGSPCDVLLLNPDAVLALDDVDRLAVALHAAEERVGAVSPALRGSDGTPQRVLWPFPTPARAWLEAGGLGRLNRAGEFAVGTVLLLRWEALRDVGLFDERFFLYAEETDWQRRAYEHGWRAACEPSIVAEHIGGGTSSDPARREALFHAGAETYVLKWFGASGWRAYRLAVLAGAVPRGLLLPGDRGATARLRRHLYWEGPRAAAGLGVA
jgi:GT2 family glycosyltransferase